MYIYVHEPAFVFATGFKFAQLTHVQLALGRLEFEYMYTHYNYFAHVHIVIAISYIYIYFEARNRLLTAVSLHADVYIHQLIKC